MQFPYLREGWHIWGLSLHPLIRFSGCPVAVTPTNTSCPACCREWAFPLKFLLRDLLSDATGILCPSHPCSSLSRVCPIFSFHSLLSDAFLLAFSCFDYPFRVLAQKLTWLNQLVSLVRPTLMGCAALGNYLGAVIFNFRSNYCNLSINSGLKRTVPQIFFHQDVYCGFFSFLFLFSSLPKGFPLNFCSFGGT